MIRYNVEMLALAESYFSKYIESVGMLRDKLASAPVSEIQAASRYDEDEEETSRLLTMSEDVAVIEVKGALTNSSDSFWNWIFGLVSYNDIRAASMQAVEAGAKVIMFYYASPGGAVSGLADAGSFISNLPVPTITFTSASMASAAYFLGSQSDYVYADSFAEVGSIGVIVKLYDRSEMLKNAGVTPVRFRSGKLKAAGDGDFKLTKEEKDYIQSKVEIYANKFFNIVSDARGIPMSYMESSGITSGRTYIGEEAMAVNLVDSIKTFDEAMLKAYQLAKEVDNGKGNGLSFR